MRKAIITPNKLRLLADWFDLKQQQGKWGDNASTEVQEDLRNMANAIATILDGEQA